MTFIDMFCGIGTIRMGFEQAGHECVYSIEWDKHKRKIYSIIFGGEPEGADITTIRADELPRSDCWCFGAPCQDFSIAGKRAGLEGDRSSLVKEVFRLVRETKEEYRPKYLFYENVKGMLSSNKGFDFLEILAEMESLGYDTIEYSLLNSKDFGVPQNRERVFTVGHLRGQCTRKVFPIAESSKLYNRSGEDEKELHETALCLTKCGQQNWTGSFIRQIGNIMPTKTRDNPNQGRVYDIDGIAPGLNKMEGGGRQPFIKVKCLNSKDENEKQPPQQDRVYDTSGHMTALQAEQNGRFNIMVKAVLTPDRLEKKQNGRRFKKDGEPMFTLTKQDIHGVIFTQKKITRETDTANTLTARNPSTSRGNNTPITGVTNGMRIRRLTPKECWRLQGISDEITDKVIAAGISDTQMYKGAGDSCTVPVIYEIAKRM